MGTSSAATSDGDAAVGYLYDHPLARLIAEVPSNCRFDYPSTTVVHRSTSVPPMYYSNRRRRYLQSVTSFAPALLLGLFAGLLFFPKWPSINNADFSIKKCLPSIDLSDYGWNKPSKQDQLGSQTYPESLERNNITKSLLFVGVMTAKKYLPTRATAVYETWGKSVPGSIEFFSSEDSLPPDNRPDLPLVALRGVDDSYPPQKKSFLMLQYIWEHHGNKFEWFLRADDDVYIRPDKVESFLRSIDSRRPHFIGQAGRGNQEEFGLLSLEYDENFCMGGPGVIMSRETLARVAPHVKYCLKNLYTTHEDVELGRCVQKFAGIPCTWSYEMQTILYHNSSGKEAFAGDLKQKEVHRAITLHPVKQYKHLYRIHNYMKMLKIQEIKQQIILTQRDVLNMDQLLRKITGTRKEDGFSEIDLIGQQPGLTKFIPSNLSELIQWDFIQRSLYSASSSNPRRRIDAPLREGLDDVIREVMEMINVFSKQRGRVIDFREIHYGYYRYNALYGADYVIDMLLTYKKYRGRKMTVPVRRHSYLQQQFTGLSLREVYEGNEVAPPTSDRIDEQMFEGAGGGSSKAIKEAFESGLMKIGENLPSLLFPGNENDNSLSKYNLRDKVINFILPLSGRFDTFRRFVRNFEDTCLKNEEPVSLTVVLFPSAKENTLQRILDTVRGLQKMYMYARIDVVPVFENFARAKALEIGISYANEPEDLLFFIDVDMVFRSATLQRIRMNTVKGRSVYFPIVYSEFDPVVVYNKSQSPDHFSIHEDTGFWRQYGFGIASVYKSDLVKVGGLDTSIHGWGKEDVDLFEKFVASNLTIFRAADPDLVHVFHVVDCDSSLERTQLTMCRNTRADTYGSVNRLTDLWYKNKVSGGKEVNWLRTMLSYYSKTVT